MNEFLCSQCGACCRRAGEWGGAKYGLPIKKDGSSVSNTVGLKATWRIFDGGSANAGYNYIPPKYWDIPRKRPPVCITEKRCPVCPMYTDTNPVELMTANQWTGTDNYMSVNATPKKMLKNNKNKK